VTLDASALEKRFDVSHEVNLCRFGER